MQAYHNELVSKVSHLEMENVKLRKEKASDVRLSLSFFLCYCGYRQVCW